MRRSKGVRGSQCERLDVLYAGESKSEADLSDASSWADINITGDLFIFDLEMKRFRLKLFSFSLTTSTDTFLIGWGRSRTSSQKAYGILAYRPRTGIPVLSILQTPTHGAFELFSSTSRLGYRKSNGCRSTTSISSSKHSTKCCCRSHYLLR